MENYSNKATASLVLGIVSLVSLCFIYISLIGIACGVIGLIFGIGQLEGFKPSGVATAGFVLSIIGLGLCALEFISCVACVGLFSTAGLYS
jgi:hypothetical protein